MGIAPEQKDRFETPGGNRFVYIVAASCDLLSVVVSGCKPGESGGIRTHSLPVKSRKLNQLSYTLILLAERAELESDTVTGTIRLAGGPRTFRVHAP